MMSSRLHPLSREGPAIFVGPWTLFAPLPALAGGAAFFISGP